MTRSSLRTSSSATRIGRLGALAPLAAAAALLMAQPAVQASTSTISVANSNGAGVVLDAKLLNTDVIAATLPGTVKVFGSSVPGFGSAATGSTATGTPYSVNRSTVKAIADSKTLSTTTVGPVKTTTVAKVGLSADVFEGQASFSSATVVKGYGGVTNLDLGLGLAQTIKTGVGPFSTTVNVPLFSLGLTADALQTTSTIGVVNNQLFGTNTLNSFANVDLNLTSLLNANLLGSLPSILLANTFSRSLDLSALVGVNPGANTVLGGAAGSFLASLGLSLTLNEQINSCTSMVTACAVETNAIHLMVDPLVAGLAAVDLKLGHSYAAASGFAPVGAVPEPETYALMGLGLLGVVLGAHRNRRQAAKAQAQV